MQSKEIAELLKKKGLKATPQRIAVYKYLCENRVHPTVDAVYKSLVKENPSFSKTTVYNCLQTLTDSGLLIPVLIEHEQIRYDADTSFHAHFKCESCGNIYDFNCGLTDINGLNGFDVKQKDVYFTGICKNCKCNDK